MTHECAGTGHFVPRFAVYVDDGRYSTMIPRGYYNTAPEAEAAILRHRASWGPAWENREFRVVQVCSSGEPGGWQVCAGREAVVPARVRNLFADATKKVHVGQPPVGGEE